jgi:hypothetical protein
MIGADAPIPPIAMNAAAAVQDREGKISNKKNNVAPRCLGEALRRGAFQQF